MGSQREYRCNKCGYHVMTSGGEDRGFYAFTNTYICTSCRRIVDITEKVLAYSEPEPEKKGFRLFKSRKSKPEPEIFEEQKILCPECGAESGLKIWDTVNRPCPKCDGKLEADRLKFIMWD